VVGTQGFALAKQEPYILIHTSSSFLLWLFLEMGSHKLFAGTGLKP
jgi:hypothetical protein